MSSIHGYSGSHNQDFEADQDRCGSRTLATWFDT
jgi:hypothetical protein